jgi:hypothetical protein
MILSGKYEVPEPFPPPAGERCSARHVALHQTVELHFLRAGDGGRSILDRLGEIDEAKRRMFIDAGDYEGAPYVVTWPLPGGQGLREFLGLEEPKPAGEFTRLFGARPPAGDAEMRQTPPAPSPASDASEFTRLFGGSAEVEQPATNHAEPVRPQPSSAAPAQRPGEFTVLFRGAAAGAPAPEPRLPASTNAGYRPLLPADSPVPARALPNTGGPSDQPDRNPAEFTRFFRSPLAPQTGSEERELAPLPAPPQAKVYAPGEFTRVFGSGAPAAARAPLNASMGMGTTLFSKLPIPSQAIPPPPASPPPPPQAAGPGEYTRVIQAPPPVESAPVPPVAAAPPRAPALPSLPPLPKPALPAVKEIPLWVPVLAIVALLLLALAVYFYP